MKGGEEVEKRIAYYTRKVNEYSKPHVDKARNRYRFERLMGYKRAMHKRMREV